MLTNIIESVKSAPESLKGLPERFSSKREELTGRAMKRVESAVAGGGDALWTARTTALENVESLLAATPEVPVVGPLADRAEAAVAQHLADVTAVNIDGYAEMNAKDAIKAVKAVEGRCALHNVRRFESANKARKTVLKAIDDLLAEAPELTLPAVELPFKKASAV